MFTFGDAGFYGSLVTSHPSSPIIGITPTKTGKGYWLELADARIGARGDAHNYGNG